MARDFFELEKGISIVGTNSSTGVKVLFGSGAAGATTETDNAEVGSLYMDTTGNTYQKRTAGTGTDKWIRIATLNDINQFTWRQEKVTAATGDAAPSTGSSINLVTNPFGDDDSPTLVATDFAVNDHIIFGVGGTPKLMRVSVVSAPSITVVDADTALAANNNFVVKYYLPDSPDDQEKEAVVHYNGSAIIKLGDINWNFADGINMASAYSSSGVNGTISSADTVNSAIAKLEGNQTDIQTSIGIAQGSVNFGSFTGTLLIDNQTAKALFQILETEAEAVRTTLGVANGAVDMGTYTGDLLNDNESTKQNIQQLETYVEDLTKRTSQTGVTTTITQDELLVDNYCAAVWEVCVTLDSDPARKQYLEVRAIHNGHAGADASSVDDNVTNKLKLGAAFNLTVSVDLNGTGGTQTMRLRVGASAAVSVKAARRVVS